MSWAKIGREKSMVNHNQHIKGEGNTDVINLGERVDACTYDWNKGVKVGVDNVTGLNYCNWKKPAVNPDRSPRSI